MAKVAPFRAVRYNTQKIPDLAKVITPPYDVINPAQQEAFYQADPHCIIRVELNKPRPEDNNRANVYTRAAAHLDEWLAQGVLAREEAPAFYLCRTAYRDAEGQPRTRTGFLTLLRLEDFDKGIVLPHEKTFTGHKEDRLKLTKAARANVSPIFALYPDEENLVTRALEAEAESPDLADFTDASGLGQRMQRVSDPAACREVARLMADKVVFIADGHHRYETGLNYRNHMRELHPAAGPDAAFEYVMVYLCSMSDPGLTIFPCHRVLPHLHGFEARDFISLAKPYFQVEPLTAGASPEEDAALVTQTLAKAEEKGSSFCLAAANAGNHYILTLKPGAMESGPWGGDPPAVRDLDVVVLTHLILEHILGLDNNARDQVHTIKYVSDAKEVLREVAAGESRLAFLVNPTRMEQVQAVAENRLIMPRKSTYFYPKVPTGLTVNRIEPDETISLPE